MIKIGPFSIANPVFLAPMAGITDRPFRDLCARQGAGYAASEMISSDTLLHATAKTQHRIQRASNGLPHAVQIAGSDPAALSEAAVLNVNAGAEIIDINMGCPAKKVCNRLAGSALLSDPDLVKSILEAVVQGVDVPVTLKIRTGPDPDHRNGVEIAQIAEAAGIVCLAVHGRTRADRFKGQAEYDTIADIVKAVDIPVIANGDISDGPTAQSVLKKTGAAGVMIGRAAQGNPWVFREVSAVLGGKPVPPRPDRSELHAVLHEHLRGCHTLYGEYRGVLIARKHIAWYCKGLRHANVFRDAANTVQSAAEQLSIVDRFFNFPETFAAAA